MAETIDTQVPTEGTLSSSEVERKEAQKKAALVEQNKARNEAALAAMAASYGKRVKYSVTSPGEFARYFVAIRDGEELKLTEETLETVKALQPAVDYYTKVLPREFLLLPFFSREKGKNESAHFGPLPPVANKDVRLFQRALHRLQSICEVTRQSDLLRLQIKLHYYDDRDEVSPYSGMELSQVKMLYEMLFYRMFQVCKKYLEKIERSRFRPDPAARMVHDEKVIHGIVCHGLQFMHEFETQTTDKVREELIRKIGKGHSLGPRFYNDPRSELGSCSEELCALKRTFDNRLGYIPRDCGDTTCRECNYHEEELPLPPHPELMAASELVRTLLEQMMKNIPQVPSEETQSGHIHPASDN